MNKPLLYYLIFGFCATAVPLIAMEHYADEPDPLSDEWILQQSTAMENIYRQTPPLFIAMEELGKTTQAFSKKEVTLASKEQLEKMRLAAEKFLQWKNAADAGRKADKLKKNYIDAKAELNPESKLKLAIEAGKITEILQYVDEIIAKQAIDNYYELLEAPQNDLLSLKDPHGNTILHVFARVRLIPRNFEALRKKLSPTDMQKLIREKNNKGNTPLHVAALFGNDPAVREFAVIDPSLLNIRNNEDETALALATEHERNEIMDFLIAQGGQV